MSCCGVSKCPDTNPDILRQLCDLWYPYGGAVCKHMFERWYQEEQEVRDLHQEYLNSKQSLEKLFGLDCEPETNNWGILEDR